MKITISNNIEVENYTSSLLDWCNANLIVMNPTYEQLTKMGKDDTIKRKHIPKDLKLFTKNGDNIILPFGCLYGIWPIIKNSCIETNFNNCNDLSFKNEKCPLALYDYQEEALEHALKSKSGIISSSCGSGKTTIGIELIHRIGKKALWLTHTKDLMNQAAKDMKSLYPKMQIGYITDGKIDISNDITIATVQTLEKINPKYYEKEFETVVVDECHHVSGSPTFSKMFQKVLDNISARYKFGLSATAYRADSLGKTMFTTLGMNQAGTFEPIFKVSRERTNTLTAEHIMIPVDTPNSYETLNADGTIEYNKLIDYLSQNKERNEYIVGRILDCNIVGRKQAVLCLRVEHCKELYEMLALKGIKVELITGKTQAKKREQALNETDNWDVIVSTVALFKEGINIKALDTVHLCSPVKDKSAVIQSCGRCERVLENKKEPKFYDYVDVNIPYCLSAYKKRKRFLNNRG